jgi:oxaloacetate decarboxylase alpha subunit
MAKLELVDVSVRDGNQSLWGAVGLNAQQILTVAPIMDRVGFRALDFCSSTHMGVSVRNHRQNPWELIRNAKALMPNTLLQLIGTGFRFISWEVMHPDFMQLVYDRLVASGIERFVVLDPMHDWEAIESVARMVKKAGGSEVMGALTYTISPVHDDAFYVGLAEKMGKCPDIDRAYLKDPSGLLMPERARQLIPALVKALGGKALELHSHCTIGLAPLTYMAAAELGVSVLHVASGALSSGGSLPDGERVVDNLHALGHSVEVDRRQLSLVASYFSRLAQAEGLPAGTPQEFDAGFLRHQMAGGAITTLKRQLEELKLGHRFDEVMEEIMRVREELGSPIMVTPFPQMLSTQAVQNILGKERYANVSDQIIRYLNGRFGRPTGPVDPNVRDRIMDRPRARELADEPPPLPPSELRKRFSPGISDEEFLLRAVMPAEQVDAMIAAGPAPRHYNPDTRTLLKLLKEMQSRTDVNDILIEKPNFSLRLKQGSESAHV